MQKFIILFVFLLSSSVFASQVGNRVIASGRHAGKKLIDVVQAYTVPGTRLKIPVTAIENSFEFFDRYYGSRRRFQQLLSMPSAEDPSVISFYARNVEMVGPTIWNANFIVIFDLNQLSTKKRLHVVNLDTGDIRSMEASHGVESDCGGGRACRFVSDRESKASPLGFFALAEMYNGPHGKSIRMNGLQTTNDFPSTIVMHPARYVGPGHAGRSWGCVALSYDSMADVREDIKEGALFYFYHDSLNSSERQVVVSGLESATERSVPDGAPVAVVTPDAAVPAAPIAPAGPAAPAAPGVPSAPAATTTRPSWIRPVGAGTVPPAAVVTQPADDNGGDDDDAPSASSSSSPDSDD